MAIQDLDTRLIRESLNNVKTKTSTSKIEEINNNLSLKSYLDNDTKTVLTSSIKKLMDEKYKDLKDKADYYLGFVTDIESYKNLYEENEKLEKDIKDTKSTSSNASTEQKVTNLEGLTADEIQKRIEENKTKMKAIETKLQKI